MCWTGKKSYPNGASAMREARKLKRWNRGGHPLRPYRCPDCHQFHLANDINRSAGNPYLRRWRERRSTRQIVEAADA